MRLSFAIGLLVFSMGSVQAQSDADLSSLLALPTQQLMDGEAARQVVETKIVTLKEEVDNKNIQYGTSQFRDIEMEIVMYDNILTGFASTINRDGSRSYTSLHKAIVYGLQTTYENFDGGISLQELGTLRNKAINTLKQ